MVGSPCLVCIPFLFTKKERWEKKNDEEKFGQLDYDR